MRKVYVTFFALVLMIGSCSKKTSAPTASINAEKIFANDCARCHGPQGVKDERTPNLQTIDLDKAGLIHGITYGKNHMPAWEDKLSAVEISALADLIISWHNK